MLLLKGVIFENETDALSRNVGNKRPIIPLLTFQNSEDLIV
jgi:hypothetical protein